MDFVLSRMIVAVAMTVAVAMIFVSFSDFHEWEQNIEQIRQGYQLFQSWHANGCDIQTAFLHLYHAAYQEDDDGDDNDDVFLLDDVIGCENATTARPETGLTPHK
jgi:hypothetical protein